MMAQRNMQNGTCFDPAQARFEREKARQIKAEQEREAARKEHAEQMRNYGRMLDQIEQCYRQHTPAQNTYTYNPEVSVICPLDLTTMIREGSL